MLVGHVGDEDVLLVRRGHDVFAVGAHCTHYHGPLVDGLVVDDTVRCPWHHACFGLRTGEALRAPALSPSRAGRSSGVAVRFSLREKRNSRRRSCAAKPRASAPEKIVIVGGGAAGFAAAEKLRREEYEGSLVMLSSDDALPLRPAKSFQGLSGRCRAGRLRAAAPSRAFIAKMILSCAWDEGHEYRHSVRREVVLAGGTRIPYERLLLATGAEPVRLRIPGADQPHVRTLRSLADCNAIIEYAKQRAARLSSGRASSASRSLPHCARVGSRFTSWRRKNGRWSEFWVRKWATSFAPCTRNTA